MSTTTFPSALRARLRAERATLADDARVLRDASAGAAGVSADAFPVALTPVNPGRVAPLPRARRRAFRAHLARVIHEASRRRAAGVRVEAAPVPPLPAALDAVLGAACATCGGSCCRRGGERAFLAPETLGRWLDAHPEARTRDALGAYLAHLAPAPYEDSCVYHGAAGCTLPRAMRSDTCNRFLCGALAQIERACADADAPRAFVAAGAGGEIAAAAFVDAREVRVVRARGRSDR